jgi:hypothetical protein
MACQSWEAPAAGVSHPEASTANMVVVALMAPGQTGRVLVARTVVAAGVAAQLPAGVRTVMMVAEVDLSSHHRRTLSLHLRELVQAEAEEVVVGVVEVQMKTEALVEEAMAEAEVVQEAVAVVVGALAAEILVVEALVTRCSVLGRILNPLFYLLWAG